MSDAKTIYTDDFGNVTEEQWQLYKKFNVSPADHTELVEVYGSGDPARESILEAVRKFTHDGMYSSYHMVRDAQRRGLIT